MAATYVKISRQEFEDWLFELCPVFERVDGTTGIYLVPLSFHVAVKIATTLSSSGSTTRRGDGRCHMRLVSRHGGRLLRGPEPDVRHGNRTRGWKENWRVCLKEMSALFRRHVGRYHELATQSQEDYSKEWRERIESIARWKDFDILADLHETLSSGMWLTPKQETAVWMFLRPARSRKAPAKSSVASARPATPIAPDAASSLKAALADLEEEARAAGDGWTVKFVDSVTRRVGRGLAPTTRQREVMIDKFKRYGISVPAAA